MPASKINKRLPAGSLDWNPILRWTKEQVFARIAQAGLILHEAYRIFGASRVSCAFCIMSKGDDLLAALRDPRNRPLFERMCELEITSRFAFQSGKWLSQLAPDLRTKIIWNVAREHAKKRDALEAMIPKHCCSRRGGRT